MLRRFVGPIGLRLALASLSLLGGTAIARAQFVYADITTTGQGAPNDRPTGSRYTYEVADDITVGTGFAGVGVNQIQFTVANFDTVALTITPIVNIYDTSGTGGAPGTNLAHLVFSASSFPANSYTILTYTATGTIFTVPSNGSFWAGQVFQASTAANAQYPGMILADPPTVGSSADEEWDSNGAVTGAGSNPAGMIIPSAFGSAAIDNYYFTFANVPEPGACALFAAFLPATVVGILRRRRRGRRSNASV